MNYLYFVCWVSSDLSVCSDLIEIIGTVCKLNYQFTALEKVQGWRDAPVHIGASSDYNVDMVPKVYSYASLHSSEIFGFLASFGNSRGTMFSLFASELRYLALTMFSIFALELRYPACTMFGILGSELR